MLLEQIRTELSVLGLEEITTLRRERVEEGRRKSANGEEGRRSNRKRAHLLLEKLPEYPSVHRVVVHDQNLERLLLRALGP